jgi:hypothetical protein
VVKQKTAEMYTPLPLSPMRGAACNITVHIERWLRLSASVLCRLHRVARGTQRSEVVTVIRVAAFADPLSVVNVQGGYHLTNRKTSLTQWLACQLLNSKTLSPYLFVVEPRGFHLLAYPSG